MSAINKRYLKLSSHIQKSPVNSAVNINITIQNKANEKCSQKFDFGKCKICFDNATGVHYGSPTCEGCKVSFNHVL